ncbi:MAG: family 1 glycosylhydrolase, partial [Gemmatimonadaceae bacterium]|nr:family 1 glycosylhydrolase [Gemmatimonadaceae bacterium]
MNSVRTLEMWGGVECTVNRVGDRYFDQVERTGHMSRLDDLDRFADLGPRALRFPLLWDHVQPERDGAPDWRWADRALERLRARGVRPIVGLLHHGFGPRWVDVRDPSFAERFARYARMVAERYPWIDAYTPINEPL